MMHRGGTAGSEGTPAYLFFSWECTVISRMVCISPFSSCTFSINGVAFPVLVNQHWQATFCWVPRTFPASFLEEFTLIPNAISRYSSPLIRS